MMLDPISDRVSVLFVTGHLICVFRQDRLIVEYFIIYCNGVAAVEGKICIFSSKFLK